jgi:AraC-like DNA-binding protein
MPTSLKSFSFPLAHYHGISIQIEIPVAAAIIEDVCELLRLTRIDLRAIKKRLLTDRPYFPVRGTDEVTHIFSELYNAPLELKESYIRLKLIELLLFLSVAEPENVGKRRYYYKTRVEAVKAMRDYITANLDKQLTLPELSKLFDIPLTAMKSCFKSVFGTPVGEYLREFRLQTASVKLRETDEPIADVAAKVGYDSHTRFTAAFKTYLGMTPSEYRKIAVRTE